MQLVKQYLSKEDEKRIINSLMSYCPREAIGKAKRRLLRDDRSFEIFPGIHRDSIEYKSFLRALYERASGHFTGSIDYDGLFKGYPALPHEASHLRYMPGVGRPHLNFGRERNSIGISADLNDHVKLVVNVLLGQHTGKIGRITRHSMSGFPFFSNDHKFKLRHLDLLSQNLSLFTELYKKRDMENLLNKLGVSFVSNTQIRLQTDRFIDEMPKDRPVTTFRSAYFGEEEFVKDERMFDNFFGRCRTRVVCAMPGLINNMMSCVFEGFKDYMFSTYEKTFRHKGITDVQEKIDRYKHVIGSDIVSFDNKAPEDLINLIIDYMPLSDLGRQIVKDLLYGPYFCGDGSGVQDAHISEDWRNKEYSTWKGMPSGIFFTTVINCIQVVVIKTWEFSRFYPELKTENGLHRWLKHELNIASLIMSDDNQDLFNDDAIYDYYLNQEGYQNMLIPVEVEKGVSFLGIRSYRDEDNVIRYCQSPVTYLVNQYIPEKKARSFYRPYPVLGLQLREAIFQTIPGFNNLKEIENQLWHDILGISREQYIAIHAKEELSILERESAELHDKMLNLTDVEREVLVDPTKLHYKFSEEDVSPIVIGMIAERIPQDIFDRFSSVLLK